MSAFVVSAIAFWLLCALLSLSSRWERDFVRRGLYHAAALAALAFAAGWVLKAAGGAGTLAAAAAVVVLAAGAAVLIPWWAFLVGHYFERAHRFAHGIDAMPVKRSYDAADRARRERRFDEALRLYLAEADKEPSDPEPLLRAADCARAAGRPEETVRLLILAAGRIREPEDRATALFRIAELQERELGRPEEARATLESAAETLRDTRFAPFAEERLRKLEARREAPGAAQDRPAPGAGAGDATTGPDL